MADTIVPDFPLASKSFNQSYAGNDPNRERAQLYGPMACRWAKHAPAGSAAQPEVPWSWDAREPVGRRVRTSTPVWSGVREDTRAVNRYTRDTTS